MSVDRAEVKSWLVESLRAGGLQGRGSLWRMVLSELQWVVQIDQLPYGDRLGVDVGLDLQIATTPALPTDCGIIVHLENLPVAHEFEVAMSLDADSRLDPERRRNELEGAMQALVDYLVAHSTISSIRAAYRAGDLKSAFIHRDVRPILEASDDMPTGATRVTLPGAD